jgi:YidC/Oxa1 family membrane protein insertase
MAYQPDAFDNFDVILCTGEYQIAETRERESKLNLPPKELYEHGYSRLDSLIGQQAQPKNDDETADEKTVVLVAPSWGPTTILPTCGRELIGHLLEAEFKVILRPHPETVKREPDLIRAILSEFEGNEGFDFDRSPADEDSLFRSAIMISDWSGVAPEFAFGLERPVLFVDVPEKMNNPDYRSLGITPFETSIREQIGTILSPNEIDKVAGSVRDLVSSADQYRDSITQARSSSVFNVGSSAKAGARILVNQVLEIEQKSE